MTQAKLATLEEIILHPSNWDDATNYFLDHFATEPAFLQMGQKTSLPIIIKMMGELAKHLFQKEAVALVNPMMFKVKKFHMIHGTCLVEGRLITFVYLTTVHKGVFTVSNLALQKMEHSSRVSALPLDQMDDEDEMYQEPWNANPN
ncbi:MAG: hypothetical protein ABMA02_12310 [Saprospiraceae bacterium]